MPGRIMAMIATAPLQKRVKGSWGMVTGAWVTISSASATPAAIATIPWAPQWAWRAISRIAPRIRPKKKANRKTGCSAYSQVIGRTITSTDAASPAASGSRKPRWMRSAAAVHAPRRSSASSSRSKPAMASSSVP